MNFDPSSDSSSASGEEQHGSGTGCESSTSVSGRSRGPKRIKDFPNALKMKEKNSKFRKPTNQGESGSFGNDENDINSRTPLKFENNEKPIATSSNTERDSEVSAFFEKKTSPLALAPNIPPTRITKADFPAVTNSPKVFSGPVANRHPGNSMSRSRSTSYNDISNYYSDGSKGFQGRNKNKMKPSSTRHSPTWMKGLMNNLAKTTSTVQDIGSLEVAGATGGASKEQESILAEFQQYLSIRDTAVEKHYEEVAELEGPESRAFNRTRVPPEVLEMTRGLPIFKKKGELVDFIKNHQVSIIVGETGSGKSTQISQYLVDAGFAEKAMIGITQPRRMAARTLAERVTVETGTRLGNKVGYAVRFEKCVSKNTLIKYMTDGFLLKECIQEPNLNSYSVIIVDEAHERTTHTDVCFGLLKRAAKNRPDLKVIISSATLEQQKFSQYFDNAETLNISGSCFDVEVIHDDNETVGMDYVKGVVRTVRRIHSQEKDKGDILAFLTGQDEIEEAMELLEGYASNKCKKGELLILPCYGNLPLDEQQKIFEPTPEGCRKIVLATNVAETSITIDGITFVVDCGRYKQNRYNPDTKIETLVPLRITKFQAIQRQGRAGRTRAGKCYRLYSQKTFEQMADAPDPEIQRSNLHSVILDMIRLGVANPLEFDYMDSPPKKIIFEAMEHLQELGALDKKLSLTGEGMLMSEFPLDPQLSKVLIASITLGVLQEVLKIVSMLSTQHQSLFLREKDVRELSEEKKRRLERMEGDHYTFLYIFDTWAQNKFSEVWCEQNYIQFRHMTEAKDIRRQLKGILQRKYSPEQLAVECPNHKVKENIGRAFTAGYFRQLAMKRPVGRAAYQIFSLDGRASTSGGAAGKTETFLHPSSALFKAKTPPKWIIYHEVLRTTKAFMSQAFTIEPIWVKEGAPEFAQKVENYFKVTL